MKTFELHPIGSIHSNDEGMYISLEREFIPALTALDGFSHINVIWWFDKFDSNEARAVLEAQQPYKNAPEVMGIFATRSPVRPNPIALTASEVIDIDYEKVIIRLGYIDADDDTPVLDIKPYTPSLDRVESPLVPNWCAHLPRSIEQSADFEWEKEFNF